MIPNDYKILAQLIENNQQKNSVKLTSDHLTRFKNLFQSFSQSEPSSLAEKINKEFEELIRNCDVHSHSSKNRLIHLSHIILNNFSSKSIFWILCIYKKVMQEDLPLDLSLHKFIPHLSNSHHEKWQNSLLV
ncbi:MAG: hypothetical protein HWD61_14235 [Parachlamydiaceae bacterium]|nr:MAG: hypothetical protein HWD61_14235 [Parachlamydiaceae bacterium]